MKLSLLLGAALCFAVFRAGAVVQAQPTDISAAVNIDANASFEVREETYTLPDATLKSVPADLPPEYAPHPEMVGLVIAPVNATGPRPVALFIHGAKDPCYDPTTNQLQSGWPCPAGLEPVPSYRGFVANQRFLAARGWVTVSVSVNGVNGSILAETAQSDANFRSELAEKHLEQWALWLSGDTTLPPPAFITAGVRPDLQQVLVVGHSRGGAAANQISVRSASDTSLPWRVRAQVLIGPTAANFNAAPALPTVVLLPGCDGDVLDLQGQSYIDRGRDSNGNSALRSAVFIHGANHNFFNAEWDPATAVIRAASSDDVNKTLFAQRAPEGACRPGAPERLTGEAQRDLGSFYIAAAGKAFVQGEAGIVPLFDGSLVCAGPTCRTNITTHALGGRRQPLLIPSADTPLSVNAQASITPCFTAGELDAKGSCLTADIPAFMTLARTPHFLALSRYGDDVTAASSRVALKMQWDAVGGAARIDTNRGGLSRDTTHIAARVIVPPDAVNTQLSLQLVDSAGQSLPLGTATLSGVPAKAGAGLGVYWAQEVRLPIDVAAAARSGFGVDTLASLVVTAESSSGTLWLLDAWSYAP